MTTLLPLWQRVALAVLIGLVSGVASYAMRAGGVLQAWEFYQYDLTTSLFVSEQPVPDVVLLTITDADLAKWGWPVPDAEIARLVQSALEAGAQAVGVDIYRDVPIGQGREKLLSVLTDPRIVTISRLASADTVGVAAPDGVKTGFADIPIDPDGVARRALLLVNTENGIALSFPMQLAMIVAKQKSLQPAPGDARVLALGGTPLPPLSATFGPYRELDNAGYQIMTQHRNALPIAAHISVGDLLGSKVTVAGKVVVVAITSHTVKDYFTTPLNRRTGANFAFGGEVHAAITQQLIDHAQRQLLPLRAMPEGLSVALILCASLLSALAAMSMSIGLWVVLLGIAVTALWGVALSALQGIALLAPVVPVMSASGLGFILAFAVAASIAWNQRRVMAGIFTSQMSDELAADIWKQRRRLIEGRKPVSRRLFVTVLIADIEGSTRIGHQMAPQEFMDWISKILDELGRIAQRYGGFVEKYTGDGILIVFGAPIPKETLSEQRKDARAAVECARAMRQAVDALNENESTNHYRLRIGINSGAVVGGTLGTSGAMRYNIIGDTVNVAARVEGWSKSLAPDVTGHPPICLTDATAQLVGTDNLNALDVQLLHDDGETKIPVYTVT